MFEFVCVFLCVICMFVCLSAQGRAHVSLISSVRFKVKIGEPEKSLNSHAALDEGGENESFSFSSQCGRWLTDKSLDE